MSPLPKGQVPDKAILHYALAYARRGWPVLPLHTPTVEDGACDCRRECSSVGKHPRTLSGRKDASTDPDEISRWWRMWPEANVGIVTGSESGLAVPDVDNRKGGGETLAQLTLPQTLTVETGDGLHLYFQHPGHVLRSTTDVLPGIDLKADGGYVVAPPSLHASGRRYRFAEEWPADWPLAPLPVFALRGGREAARSATAEDGRILEGTRNATLTSLAGGMRRSGLSQGGMEAALHAENAARCDPPLPDNEVASIAASVARYEPEAQDAHPEREGSPLSRHGGVGQTQTPRWITAAELATTTPPAPPWVISPFLALGVKTMLSGKPKTSGKTTFALRMIRCVIGGTAFLTTVPERTGPAVLLSEEGSVSLNQAIRRAGLQDSKHLHILQFRPGWKWRDVARDAIQKARSVGAVIVLVDTLPQWAQIPGDAENSAGVAREVFDPFSGVDDLAMVFNFHDRKSGGEPGEATRGSGAFAGAVDLIVDITRVGGDGQEQRRQLSLLGRFEVPEKLIVELGDEGYSLLGNTTDVRARDLQTAIKEALDGRTRTEQELVGVLPDHAKTSIGKELRKLVDRGEVGRSGDGKRNSPYEYFVSPAPYIHSVGETSSQNLNGDGDGQMPDDGPISA